MDDSAPAPAIRSLQPVHPVVMRSHSPRAAPLCSAVSVVKVLFLAFLAACVFSLLYLLLDKPPPVSAPPTPTQAVASAERKAAGGRLPSPAANGVPKRTRVKATATPYVLPTDVNRTLPALELLMTKIEGTLRSCLSSTCKREIYRLQQNRTIHRIGVLSPGPQNVSAALAAALRSLYFPAATMATLDVQVDVVGDSHVPPYGYGRNHGWTKIVRLYESLPIQALREVLINAPLGSLKDSVAAEVYGKRLKQLIRWHCRLNHVAAHTSLLTVRVDDFLRSPVTQMQQIASFLHFRPSSTQLRQALQEYLSPVLTYWQSSRLPSGRNVTRLPPPYNSTALRILQAEMDGTKALSQWPCLPFRALEDSRLVQWNISVDQLIPNCNASHVTCSVHHDLKEQKIL